MQIGVVCPIGPLDRFGYQHNYRLAIGSLASLAARLYLVSSTRNRSNVEELLAEFPSIEGTWFDLDEQAIEVFSVPRLEANINLGRSQCVRDQMDCAIQIHVTQYIQDRNRDKLRRQCEVMLEGGLPFDWLYKKYLLGGQFFHADTRVPWILNLRVASNWEWRADSLHNLEQGSVWSIESGDYREMDHCAIVDFPMERTVQDLMEFRAFTRGYAELSPAREVRLDWDGTFSYYVGKFAAKRPSPEKLDGIGCAIAGNSRREFVSHVLLAEIKAGKTLRTVQRIGRGGIRRAVFIRDYVRLVWHGLIMMRRLSAGDASYRKYLYTQLKQSLLKRDHGGARPELLIERIVNLTSPNCDGAVLCVGCHSTSEIDQFRQSGFNPVVGIDLFSTSPDILVMDMHSMKFADDHFDILFASHSLEHALDPMSATGEFIRVAKPGALVAIEARVRNHTQGPDLVDFGDANGLMSAFTPHVGRVLLREDIPPSAARGWEAVARVVFEVAK
jgi:SAM-dependent methyltransferase